MDKRDPAEWKKFFIKKFDLEKRGKKWLLTNPETLEQEFVEDWELDGIAAKHAKKHQ